MKSPRIEFTFNFTTTHNPDVKLNSTANIKEKEVLVFSTSPEVYDIKTFDTAQTVMNVHGLAVFFFRGNDGKGRVYLKEFQTPGNYNVREVFTDNIDYDPRLSCEHEYLNAQTYLNITLDFRKSTVHVNINDKQCIEYRISNGLFPQERSTVSFFGYSSQTAPISLTLHEISIYKMVSLLTATEASFTGSVDGLIKSIHSYDSAHFQNASLSNVLLVDVI